jgi:serine/threonine protein kinase
MATNKCIGVGSFSTVTIEKRKKMKVAVKSIDNCLSTDNSSKQLQQVLREIIVMSNFSHPNLVHSISISLKNPDSVQVVMNVADCDLSAILKTTRTCSLLTSEKIQHIQVQILLGLAYLHENDVIHRDLNPRNIFVWKNGLVKIGDFGLCCVFAKRSRSQRGKKSTTTTSNSNSSSSRSNGEQKQEKATTTVDNGIDDVDEETVRWRMLPVSNIFATPYTAPEISLCRKKCNRASDIWSAGVILCEMLVTKSSGMDRKGKKAGLPLFPFLGGGSSNEKEAVSNLISVRGGPTIEEDKIWKALFNTNIKNIFDIEISKQRGNAPILSKLHYSKEDILLQKLLKLGKNMLSYDNKRRISSVDCLLSEAFVNVRSGDGNKFDIGGKIISLEERKNMFCYELEKKRHNGQDKGEEEKAKQMLRDKIEKYFS